MFIQWLKENRLASYVLTLFRLYLGVKWVQAGWEKISSGHFDASGFMLGALKQVSGDHPAVQPWWGDFLRQVALPNAEIFNALIPWGEFLVGLGLLLGMFTSLAVLMGLTMNFAYLFSGTTSVNPQMVLAGMIVLAAGANAGRIGMDRWVVHYLGLKFKKRKLSNTPLSKSA
ncbi:DoxX family membrane protein [Fictibacillus sp. KIGAM418]|uniref:DoxX family membrane protein n=1 Tax=Fictibacillus marinisediminis TaxID=2878389 RepID=A0A9X2BD58_9BACL|nr:DoxX family membrane protein [Fictibacillus marinisediminis]MCK6257306.1 DoxX family membrane protein [Fictibacillus marinisediminis]